MIEKYECNPEYLDERAWVRVERRFRRGSNKKHIPLEMMLDTDSAFVQDFDGLETLLGEYSEYVGETLTVAEFTRKKADIEKSIMLSKKLYWGSMHVGRLVRTMVDMGQSEQQIVEYLVRDNGLDDFIDDLNDETPEIEVG